jgi:hypothetical protein
MGNNHHTRKNDLSHHDYGILKRSWLSYVREERKSLGLKAYLPSKPKFGGCHCDRSNFSYPHWPPSCYEEALDELQSLLSESEPTRKYTARCWVAFLKGKLARPDQWQQSDLAGTITLVQDSCPILSSDHRYSLRESNQTAKHWGRNDCDKICQPVFKEKRCWCLCCCPKHREDCPVHRCY